jgi:TPR repeat protein
MRRWLLLCLLAVAPASPAFDARAEIERAVALVESGATALARTCIEPALVAPNLSPEARARAYYVRGYSFQADGLPVSAAADYHRALEYDPENAVVMSALAQLHIETAPGRGLGPDRLPGVAFALLERAAEDDVPDARLQLGYLYLMGIGVDADLAAARRWFEAAAATGSASAMVQLARTWRPPHTEPSDGARALDWLTRAAAAGAPDAMASAGFMAENGELGAPDPKRARAYFEQAAAAGSALGQTKLAHVLLSEDAPDPARAFDLFKAAADQDFGPGYAGLAYLYEAGIGVAPDAERAAYWLERAANAGEVDAQLALAARALTRSGGRAEATRWLAAAALAGDSRGMNDYAWLLATHPDPAARDGRRAVLLAQRALALTRSSTVLDTLAAAHAETGAFATAVTTQEAAIAMAREEPMSDSARARLLVELESHLAAFRSGRPWRETGGYG